MKGKNLSVLVIGDRPILTLPVIRSLGEVEGVVVHFLSPNSASASGWSRFVEHHEFFRGETAPERVLEALHAMIRRDGIDILLGADENAIVLLSEHAASLSSEVLVAPVPDSSLIGKVSSKSGLVSLLANTDVRFPATELSVNANSVDRLVSRLRFPVLLKPVRGIGGKGILKFETVDALRNHLKRADNTLSQFLVQEAIEGFDIDCSVLAKDGKILAYTIQKWWFPPTGPFKPPAGIQFVEHQETLDVAQRLCSLLSWNGVMHIDMRWDNRDETVKVLEINPRYWSSLLGSLSVGVNFPHLHCLLAQGRDFPLPQYRREGFLVERRVAVKELAKNILPLRSNGHLRIGQTSLKYTLRDPLPDVVNLLKGEPT